MSEIRRLYYEAETRAKVQETTQRLKLIDGDAPTVAARAWAQTRNLWHLASTREGFASPLVQYRCILPREEEECLIKYQSELQDYLGNSTRVWIPGGIPYQVNGEQFGLYYLQMASPDRHQYSFPDVTQNITHTEAVARGLMGRNRPQKQLPDNIAIVTIADIGGQIVQICDNEPIGLSEDALIEALIRAHRTSFDFPHDKGQRTKEGLRSIMTSNPLTFAYDRETTDIAGVGILERDERFTHGGIALVEPTYFTDPRYRQHGISGALRRETQRIFTRPNEAIYGGRSTIVFNESIRPTSFGISLASGSYLPSGFGDNFDGKLGEAYTYLGPANPCSGLMPMGLTHFVGESLRIIE